MVAAPNSEPEPMTEVEYLEFEQTADTKHEFAYGEIIDMVGASRRHNLICTNVVANLHQQFGNRPCEVYQSDMRVQVRHANAYRYPDIVAVCGEPQFADTKPESLLNPTVLIEVLSPSTMETDRLLKLDEYRHIPSVQEYLIISQDRVRVEHHQRQSESSWLYTDIIDLDAMITITSLDCTLSVNDIYQRITFEG